MGEQAGNGSPEAELLERIRRDEPGAFDQLVDEYGGRILGFGMRMCGEREDAQDVVQETLIKAYEKLQELQHPRALRSWLYKVAANACLMKRRKGKYEPTTEIPLEELRPSREPEAEGLKVEIPDPAELPDRELERQEVRDRVRRAIAQLPPHYRIVVLMRDIEHLSTRETAEALGVAETAVKMRLHRGRLMVREELEKMSGDGVGGGGS
jgi:RNA polymerase sigma-70 factor (ECF subfamily)